EVPLRAVPAPGGLAGAAGGVCWGPRGALLSPPPPSLLFLRPLPVDLPARPVLPAISVERYFTEIGGLMSYGPEDGAIFRQASVYIDRILKQAKPSDMPRQLLSKFELVINLQTAKAPGIDVPPNLPPPAR